MMQARRILYIHRSSGFIYGGALTDLLNIVSHLDSTRYAATVLLSRGTEPLPLLSALGVDVIHLPLPAVRKGKSIPFLPFAVLRLWRLLRAKEIALVHVNDADDAAIASVACRLAGVPCVVHARSEMAPGKFRKLRLQWADLVMTVSEGVKRQAIAGGVSKEKVATLYSGIDPRKVQAASDGQRIRRAYGIAAGSLVVGSVGNIAPIKGYETLIAAMAAVQQEIDQVICLIVGADDRGLKKQLEGLGQSVGLGGRVHFAGFQREVAPYVDAMDVFVLASVQEGFGIALLEAMARGKPVVATAVSGPCEIVEDGRTGLLVPPKDANAMAKALLDLLRDPARRVYMGTQGQERIKTIFSLESQMANLTALYDQLLRNRCPRSEEVV